MCRKATKTLRKFNWRFRSTKSFWWVWAMLQLLRFDTDRLALETFYVWVLLMGLCLGIVVLGVVWIGLCASDSQTQGMRAGHVEWNDWRLEGTGEKPLCLFFCFACSSGKEYNALVACLSALVSRGSSWYFGYRQLMCMVPWFAFTFYCRFRMVIAASNHYVFTPI